jgi:hypothetical protein
MLERHALANGMIIVINNIFLTSLQHQFNLTVTMNFPGYEYVICKNMGRSAPPNRHYISEFLPKGIERPPPLTPMIN